MVCDRCARAADQHAGRDQHCGSTGGPGAACTCQHRTDRYQGRDGFAAVAAFYDRLGHALDAHAAAVEAAIARVEAEHGPDDTITIPYVTTKD